MLPKVATTILHSTSRAAAAVQGQSHTIRNVLQLQSSSPSSSSKGGSPGSNYFNSNWNGGPSSGGPRGGRFTHGYLGASRAVTQAQPVVANDTGYSQYDEYEETVVTKRITIHPPRRLRSHSLSYIPPERTEKLGVLNTVQLFARSRHAFAQPVSTDDLEAEVIEPPSPVLTRRNSTASATWNESSVDVPPPPPPPSQSSPPFGLDNVTPVKPPSDPLSLESTPNEERSEWFQKFVHLRDSGSSEAVIRAVKEFRAVSDTTLYKPAIHDYNAALEALYRTRQKDQPLTLMLELYNHLLGLGIVPNYRTYVVLIKALCERDHEVIWALTALENREKWRKQTALPVERPHTPTHEKQQKEALEAENNFPSALSLFQALVSITERGYLPWATFNDLLRSCAHYGNIDAAIIIWENFEKRTGFKANAIMYKYMMQTFGYANEITAAEDIFLDFKKKCAQGLIEWSTGEDNLTGPGRALVMTWNLMIEAYFKAGMPDMAVSLVEEMMKAQDSSDGSTDGSFQGTPLPSPATFTTVIAGFCQSGDLQTASAWFERLLQQSSAPGHPFDSTSSPSRPDTMAWRVMMETYASKPEMVSQLNALWLRFLDHGAKDGVLVRNIDRMMVLKANIDRIAAIQNESNGQSSSEQSTEIADILAFIEQHIIVLESPILLEKNCFVWEQLCKLGFYTTAVRLGLQSFESEAIRTVDNQTSKPSLQRFGALVFEQTRAVGEAIPFKDVLRLHTLWRDYKMNDRHQVAAHLLHHYGLVRRVGLPEMSEAEWNMVLADAAKIEILPPSTAANLFPGYAFEGILPLLEDMKTALPEFKLEPRLKTEVLKAALWDRSFHRVREFFERLGFLAEFSQELEDMGLDQSSNSDAASTWSQPPTEPRRYDSPAFTTPPTSPEVPMKLSVPEVQYERMGSEQSQPPRNLFMDRALTKRMEEALTKRVLTSPDPRSTVNIVWDMFERGLRQHRLPTPHTIARLCQALGRAKELDKVKQVYAASQSLLATMENNKKLQSDSWFIIEDGMIIAFAQAAEIDAAHVHRLRILEHGGAPSADAYGGLILHVKDTTDDTSNAMALYQESQARGVIPNQYLYNNIISKLAKARKADAALELFIRMKESGILPSSITYGAVIGACARVGDVASAEVLFTEMTQASNFKPRIPPFNTMMQLYTTTKPNRERALFFYNEILKAGVTPTEYTYKLLMEAYVIEPIDIQQVEEVFQHLCANRRLEVQGTHFATLINAYGCVAKDLDKALAVYDSIATHPRRPKMDALVFEALTNVFVAHRRMDLVPEYISQMSAAGVHMTAYIVNLLIKGYAAVGDVEKARELFESLVDPPEGIAALHNHAPHEPSKSPVVDPMAPVYREPSTWEAMVRAELGAGHRDRAAALLERLKTRQYPEAVFNRISGIMVDHSQILP